MFSGSYEEEDIQKNVAAVIPLLKAADAARMPAFRPLLLNTLYIPVMTALVPAIKIILGYN